MAALYDLSARELGRAYRERSLSPVEVVQAVLGHMARWEPHLQATYLLRPDLALEQGSKRTTAKVLTTPDAPERGVMQGLHVITRTAGVAPGDIALIIHGTTLATNAIIERKGARTALVTTEGFRDVIAMGNESRYDQYDLNIVLPEPLVPRHLRLPAVHLPRCAVGQWAR